MRVFKFGGASVKDSNSVLNLKNIVESYSEERLVIVISAMGKTTNLLEKLVTSAYHSGSEVEFLLEQLKEEHFKILNGLFKSVHDEIFEEIQSRIDALNQRLLKLKRAEASYDYFYDQIVSDGEIIATRIIHHFLNHAGIKNIWVDARECIRTNLKYRNAEVNWEQTEELVQSKIQFSESTVFLTQGFIAGAENGHTTTLGREGSDFSAAILAYVLNAQEVTIWKDVPGLLNADPKFFENTKKLDNISYHEAVELAYYGATVIHPKTIKPLQNKRIPLYVKPFANMEEAGTVIHEDMEADSLVPSYIFKPNQVLISISSRDYSFVMEENLSQIFGFLAEFGIKINLMQNSAISFSICIDFQEDKLENLVSALKKKYKVLYNTGLELMTIRHYDQKTLDLLMGNKEILVEQRSRHTARIVMKDRSQN